MMNVIYAVLLLGGMGLISGLLLTFVSKKFAVEKDPRLDQIRDALSGANCGACGFPGCDACADAMLTGKAEPSACPVGGPDAEAKIRAILGLEAAKPVEAPKAEPAKTDAVKPAAPAPAAKKPHRYAVINQELCVGCTMCKRNCKFNAIEGEVKQKHSIDKDKCFGCGLCASKCPKKCITVYNADGTEFTPPAPKAPAAAN